jgi:hypothetical protein
MIIMARFVCKEVNELGICNFISWYKGLRFKLNSCEIIVYNMVYSASNRNEYQKQKINVSGE